MSSQCFLHHLLNNPNFLHDFGIPPLLFGKLPELYTGLVCYLDVSIPVPIKYVLIITILQYI